MPPVRPLRGWQEIADHLEVTPRHAQRLCKSKGLPVHSGGLGSPWAAVAELDAWVRGHGGRDADASVLTPATDLLGPTGGALPLDSPYYVERPVDQALGTAILQRTTIVLLKGARQTGKTSLLARALAGSRRHGACSVVTDLQKLNGSQLATAESFYLGLADLIAEQLDLPPSPPEAWAARRAPNLNFQRFLTREVLPQVSGHFVWGLDEVDRLFPLPFGSDVFALFRSWHNERALEPSGPWGRVTLALAYATAAHLFITDVNQSPFNVGARFVLDDLVFEEAAELNRRYGSPLRAEPEVRRLFLLLGGQPYLSQRALQALTTGGMALDELEVLADREDGPLGDHLRHVLASLVREPALADAMRQVLANAGCPPNSFYRLRSAGLVRGESPELAQPRSLLYARFLKRHIG